MSRLLRFDVTIRGHPVLAREHGAEVVTLTLDIGQDQELEEVRDRALAAGAVRAHVLDAREEFAHEFVLPALQAGALRDGARADGISARARARRQEAGRGGADRGSGRSCASRRWSRLRAHRKQCACVEPGSACHSHWRRPHERMRMRTNLWGRAVDYDASGDPHEALYSWTKSPETAPDTGADVEIAFEQGCRLLSTACRWI